MSVVTLMLILNALLLIDLESLKGRLGTVVILLMWIYITSLYFNICNIVEKLRSINIPNAISSIDDIKRVNNRVVFVIAIFITIIFVLISLPSIL